MRLTTQVPFYYHSQVVRNHLVYSGDYKPRGEITKLNLSAEVPSKARLSLASSS